MKSPGRKKTALHLNISFGHASSPNSAFSYGNYSKPVNRKCKVLCICLLRVFLVKLKFSQKVTSTVVLGGRWPSAGCPSFSLVRTGNGLAPLIRSSPCWRVWWCCRWAKEMRNRICPESKGCVPPPRPKVLFLQKPLSQGIGAVPVCFDLE